MATIQEALAIAVKQHQAGRLREAEKIYRDILKVEPRHPDALNLLGVIAHQSGDHGKAIELIGYAISLRPNEPSFHNNFGTACLALGRTEEAVRNYEIAIRNEPDFLDAYHNLGLALKEQCKYSEAAQIFEKAILIDPEFAKAHYDLGGVYKYLGKTKEALVCYENAFRIEPSNTIRHSIATTLPIIYHSAEEVDAYRNRIMENLTKMLDEGYRMDPVKENMSNIFHLAYQGRNDRKIHEMRWKLCSDSSRDFTRTRPVPAHAVEKIRIGFISSYFCAHTVSKMWRGVMEKLDRQKFSVTALSLDPQDDPMTRLIRTQVDSYIDLPKDLSAARQKVADECLDILFYTDIGMELSAHALAVSRLAPIQCVTWGHPVTTGMETMDYFISSELLETDEAEDHYTEELVRLKTLGVYYYRPNYPLPRKERSDFGLPTDKHLYACLQTSFKLDPGFDDILGAILRRDTQGEILLSSGICPQWDSLLMQRFENTIPDVVERIGFFPRRNYNDYIRLINVIDVLLIPSLFGGGDTSFEALAFGVPIVTLPSQLLRGRITYALYRILEVFDCVAKDPEEYVDIAVRLGTDAGYRAGVRERILASSDRLFEDMVAVRELESFLEHSLES